MPYEEMFRQHARRDSANRHALQKCLAPHFTALSLSRAWKRGTSKVPCIWSYQSTQSTDAPYSHIGNSPHRRSLAQIPSKSVPHNDPGALPRQAPRGFTKVLDIRCHPSTAAETSDSTKVSCIAAARNGSCHPEKATKPILLAVSRPIGLTP